MLAGVGGPRLRTQQAQLQAWRDGGAVPGERPKAFYRLEAVFDRTQVEPLPAPAVPAPLDPPIASITGETLACALPVLGEFADGLGVQVQVDAMREGCDGYYQLRTRRIALSAAVSRSTSGRRRWCTSSRTRSSTSTANPKTCR